MLVKEVALAGEEEGETKKMCMGSRR